MRRPPLSTLAPLAAALLLAPAAGGAQGAERHALAGEEVAVYHVAGTLRVVPGAGRDVTVEVTRRGRDAGELRVERGEIGGRETLRVYPRGGRLVYPAMGSGTMVRTRLRRDGTFGDGSDEGFSGPRVFSRAAGDQFLLRGRGDGPEAWADVTVGVPAGRRVALYLMAGDASVRDVEGDLLLDVGAAGIASERTRGRLLVDAGSGPVRVADAQGEVDLNLGSGDVELSRVRGPSLRVDAGSGAVRAADLDAERMELDLGSGNTTLRQVRARSLSIDGGSGDLDVGLLTGAEEVRVESGSGSVTLRVPEGFGATLDVDTGSGGITSDLPIDVTRRERDHLTGRIGDGRARLSIETGSGSVRLRRG